MMVFYKDLIRKYFINPKRKVIVVVTHLRFLSVIVDGDGLNCVKSLEKHD